MITFSSMLDLTTQLPAGSADVLVRNLKTAALQRNSLFQLLQHLTAVGVLRIKF